MGQAKNSCFALQSGIHRLILQPLFLPPPPPPPPFPPHVPMLAIEPTLHSHIIEMFLRQENTLEPTLSSEEKKKGEGKGKVVGEGRGGGMGDHRSWVNSVQFISVHDLLFLLLLELFIIIHSAR